jgi:hypothetical protein
MTPYTITLPDHAASVAARADVLLSAVAAAETALAAAIAAVATTETALADAIQTQAAADADGFTAGRDAIETQAAADRERKAAAAVTDATTKRDRAIRAVAELRGRHALAEAAITEARPGLAADVADVAQSVLEQVAAALAHDLAPVMWAHLRQFEALRVATNSPAMAMALADWKLPNVLVPNVPLIDGGVNVPDATQADPVLTEQAARVSAPRHALARLAAYVPLATRERVAAPYVVKGYTHDGVTQRSAPPARPAPPAPPAAARPRVQPQEGCVVDALAGDPDLAQFRA